MKMVFLLALLFGGTAIAQSEPPARPAVSAEVATTKRLSLRSGDDKPDLRSGSVFFVGNATVIIRYAGFTILTDPNFLHKGDEVDLGYGLKAERLTDPAIELDALPPIDFVLLSHYHGDHFDPLVEERLGRKTPIVTTPGAVEELRKKKFEYGVTLDKWETLTITKGDATMRVTAMPARHGPPVVNLALPETMGSMLEFLGPEQEPLYRLYISGDTLVFDEIARIAERYPDVDLALLHLGGTRAAGVMVTMDGKQGVEMLQIVQPDVAVPIHYNDYTVFESPIEEFVAAVIDAGLEPKLRYLRHGETYKFSPKAARSTR